MIGLTSISFRNRTVKELINLCVETGTECIEWGGDIHIPSGEFELAKSIGNLTRSKGIKILSYGSYYKVLESQNPQEEFTQIAKTAQALGASLIRVWMSSENYLGTSSLTVEKSVKELELLCTIASSYELSIGMEYHRGTLTENKENTLSILSQVNAHNLYTYWQPNPDISHEERLKEISLLSPHICSIHAYWWEKGDVRKPLKEGALFWKEYWRALQNDNCPIYIEFVKGDTFDQYKEDITILKELQS